MKVHIHRQYRLVSHAGWYAIEQRQLDPGISFAGIKIGKRWSEWEHTHGFDSGIPWKDATLSDFTAAMKRLHQKECELRKDPVVLLDSSTSVCP